MNLFRRVTAELIGTAMLLAAVVGSGIMAERLAGGNAAIALLRQSKAKNIARALRGLAARPLEAIKLLGKPATDF